VTRTSLEEFTKKNIWSKLGATSTTFHPEEYPDALPAPLEMGSRLSVNQGASSLKQGKILLKQPSEDDLGGIGLFSTPRDYMKLIAALLRGGYPLLSDASVDLLFQPQLSDASRAAMPKGLGAQMRRVLGIKCSGDITQADHCLAGTIITKDISGRRRAGTVNWSGMPNLHWVRLQFPFTYESSKSWIGSSFVKINLLQWIDRKTGIAAGFFTQLLPPGDAAVTGLLIELEEAVYKAIARDHSFKL
jgi:CubicO group peptidase (beta-lactamase class C family)